MVNSSGFAHLSLQQVFGWVFAPVAGAWRAVARRADDRQPARDRMALNEFVAYSQLGRSRVARSEVVHDRDVRAVRLRQLQLDRHPDWWHRRAGPESAVTISRLGLRAMFAGTLASHDGDTRILL